MKLTGKQGTHKAGRGGRRAIQRTRQLHSRIQGSWGLALPTGPPQEPVCVCNTRRGGRGEGRRNGVEEGSVLGRRKGKRKSVHSQKEGEDEREEEEGAEERAGRRVGEEEACLQREGSQSLGCCCGLLRGNVKGREMLLGKTRGSEVFRAGAGRSLRCAQARRLEQS